MLGRWFSWWMPRKNQNVDSKVLYKESLWSSRKPVQYPTWAHIASMPHVIHWHTWGACHRRSSINELIPPLLAPWATCCVIKQCVSLIALHDDIHYVCEGFPFSTNPSLVRRTTETIHYIFSSPTSPQPMFLSTVLGHSVALRSEPQDLSASKNSISAYHRSGL